MAKKPTEKAEKKTVVKKTSKTTVKKAPKKSAKAKTAKTYGWLHHFGYSPWFVCALAMIKASQGLRRLSQK